ncbi:MAG: DivIVA domain-containing protein [Oscillospiraceae bacterium]|nr:DivIVA domain-containing protein [Oscillospiraceae bacterium]
MLTPQDITEQKFEKARIGGYDMALVDDFLERVHEDYTALYKDNAALKGKLKVLVEKVEEYRSTEESMRMALLTAQKMGHEIVEEAKGKGNAILAEINEQAQKQSTEVKQQQALEEAKLLEARRKTSLFSKRVLDLIAEEKAFLEQLEELHIEAPVAATPAPAAPPVQAVAPTPPVAEPEVPVAPVTPVAPITPPPVAEPLVDTQVMPPIATEPEMPLDDNMEDSIGAYLAQEVSRLASDPSGEASPFVEDATANSNGLIVETELKGPSTAEEVDYFKLFDQDHMDAAFAEEKAPAEADTRAAEKADIAQSISAALGDTEELKVDVDAFWDDEGQPTTKRPQFNFDDLQFGTNLDDE